MARTSEVLGLADQRRDVVARHERRQIAVAIATSLAMRFILDAQLSKRRATTDCRVATSAGRVNPKGVVRAEYGSRQPSPAIESQAVSHLTHTVIK